MKFKPGDLICRSEGLGLEYFKVVSCDDKFVFFRYLDDPDQLYYGLLNQFKLVPSFKQLSLF